MLKLSLCLAAGLIVVCGTSDLCEAWQEEEKPAAKSEQKSFDLSLFDGKTIGKWKVLEEFSFKKHGEVIVKDGELRLEQGSLGTGIAWTGELPRINYEFSWEAKRTKGEDFFSGVTFPIHENYCTLILGGWGGGATGLSNLDDLSAIENETTGFTQFENDKWYACRLRVTEEKIEAWIDDKQIVSVKTGKHRYKIWWEQEPARPLGITTWKTSASLRKLHLKSIEPK